jgi:hypothetical protein
MTAFGELEKCGEEISLPISVCVVGILTERNYGEAQKNFRIVGVRAETRTAHLSNTEVFCSTRDGVSP